MKKKEKFIVSGPSAAQKAAFVSRLFQNSNKKKRGERDGESKKKKKRGGKK